MLLFIGQDLGVLRWLYTNFNTSHVTVYRGIEVLVVHIQTYFNTSHVTVYHYRVQWFNLYNSISIHLMLLFIDGGPVQIGVESTFQYISCYCLSQTATRWTNFHRIFQYISCYCLSHTEAVKETLNRNFNTSHVTVYRNGVQKWQMNR